MRNLKRALSLTLASVMLLGMMVVGSSAAAGYDDVSETDNVEAIEVLQAIEVMVGDERGFGPERPVNRAEMAVVMGKLLNLDYNYYSATCPFDDVYDWARGWVGACAANKIVSGRGDGVYDPGATVTAVEAASMLMRALGYFQYSNDYADGFEVSTVRMGTTIGIFDQVGSSATEPMTRNQIAQMVLNALQSAVVEPDGNTINLTTPDGTVYTGKVNYVSVTSAKPFARAIGRTQATSVGSQNDGYIVELGERLYDGKLKLNDDYDPFGRPSRNWEFDGKNIGVYVKKELMVFDHVGSVAGKDLYDVLGSKTIEDYKLTVNLDGVKDPAVVRAIRNYDRTEGTNDTKKNVDYVFNASDLNRNNKATIGDTGTGVLTQVFVDNEADTIDIAVINTYLARATQNYDTRREELTVDIYSVVKNTTSSDEFVKVPKSVVNGRADIVRVNLGVDEFPVVKDAAEKDAFLVTVADGTVQTVASAEVLSGVQISSFKRNDHVVVDGTTYNFDTTTDFDYPALKLYTDENSTGTINLKDLTYNVYLDQYGNLIGVEEVDAKKNYVFISAMDLNDSNLVNGTADARAIFLDGTVDTIRVNMAKSTIKTYGQSVETEDEVQVNAGYHRNSILNTWCTYTVNNAGVYTLTQVKDITRDSNEATITTSGGALSTKLAQYHQTVAADTVIDKKHITVKGRDAINATFSNVYGNKDTVYLVAELDELVNEGNTGNTAWGVISGVDTITTGIANADMTIWPALAAANEADDNQTTADPAVDTRYASQGVYTLYNDSGIVIAAVVVGENNGASKNLVYVHTDSIESEAYNGNTTSRASGDGMWTWTRKVISDGREVTLTEVSDGNSYLERMVQDRWYQIKTNGDGNVMEVYRLNGVETTAGKDATFNSSKLERYKDYALDWRNGGGDTGNIGEIAYTVQQGASTVLYFNQDYITSQLRMNGNTLFVHTEDQTGFIVNEDVRYVIKQWDSNKKETYIEAEGSGASGLKSMVDEVNRRHTNAQTNSIADYTYKVSAVIESGIASSVIIYFGENDYNQSTSGSNKSDAAKVAWGTPVYNPFSGTINATLTLSDVKDWVATSSNSNELTVVGEVWINGAKSGDFSVGTKIANKTIALNSTNTPYYGVPGGFVMGQTYTAELRNVKAYANQVKVRMVDGNGNVIRDAEGGYRTGTDLTVEGNRFSYKIAGVMDTKADSRHALSFWFGGGDTYGDKGASFTWKVINATADNKDTVLSGSGIIAGDAGDEIKVGKITADSTGYVDIVISWTKPSGGGNNTTNYSVKSSLAGGEALLFSDDEGATWKTSLNDLAEDDVVWIKAKEKVTGDGALLVTGTLTCLDADTLQSTVAPTTAPVAGQTGVFEFTMPAKSLAITAVSTIQYCKVIDGFVNVDMSKINLKLATGGNASGMDKLELAKAYIDANGAAMGGITAEWANEAAGGTGAVTKKLQLYRNGAIASGKIAAADVAVSANAVAVDVLTGDTANLLAKNGKVHVVTDGTNNGVDDVLGLVGVDLSGTTNSKKVGSDYTYAKITAKNGDVSAAALNASTAVPDGSTIDANWKTNAYYGYVKITFTDETAAALYAANGALDKANVGTVTFALKSLVAFTAKNDDKFIKYDDVETGGILSVSMSHDKAGTVGGTNTGDKIKAAIEENGSSSVTIAADATSGAVDYTSAAAIDATNLVKDGTWVANDTKTLTVKITPQKVDMVIKVTLTSAA